MFSIYSWEACNKSQVRVRTPSVRNGGCLKIRRIIMDYHHVPVDSCHFPGEKQPDWGLDQHPRPTPDWYPWDLGLDHPIADEDHWYVQIIFSLQVFRISFTRFTHFMQFSIGKTKFKMEMFDVRFDVDLHCVYVESHVVHCGSHFFKPPYTLW